MKPIRHSAWEGLLKFVIARAGTLFVLALIANNGRAFAEDDISIDVVGTPQIRFEATSGCNTDDIPDGPLRVFRRGDGQEIGFAPHFNNLPFYIKDGVFQRHCRSAFVGARSDDERNFNDRGWITALWRDNQRHRIMAVVHNEYWGQTHEGKCKFREYLKCWTNALTLAESDDDGQSFHLIEQHVLAAGELPLAATQGARYGYSNSSNIVHRDGYFYLAAEMIGLGGNHLGTCLMRTDDIGAASKWRGWDGKGFNAHLTGRFECLPIQRLSGVMGSIVRHGGRFLAVTLAPEGASPPGVYYMTSNNLTDWSKPKLLLPATPSWSKQCNAGELRINFPSLVDLSSADINFDEVGKSAELFFVGGDSLLEGSYCKQTNKRVMSVRVSIGP
ncbi:hypothetical protein JQ604_00950 [Bradyrhizobium jicamae]|uniref:hypothetical protein n=1 Tax=Bradyrhizobium jicamae TaxID=280332 RepID=UPI001BA5CCEC|nr:hypothetical protein [Bradyrhizobium jicamae]MBR0750746.1 hypothetical protein [Bradyrhizobium jicamae]